jgi:hypothetical protein
MNDSRRLSLGASVLVGLAILFMANASMGQEASVSCPTEANSGSNVAVTMSFENWECSAVSVRVMSSIVGNADNTLGGIGVFGPIVVAPSVVVPAGTDGFCGCFSNSCDCSGNSCTQDADCPFCEAGIPGTLTLPVNAEPALPASLEGTVATVLIMSESDVNDEVETEIAQCLVEVL